MKLIHCADLHLGSPLVSISDAEKQAERRSELRLAFSRLVDRAEELGAAAVLICGDLFDRERPLKKDKEFFYSVVSSHPKIDFLYLKGNHDSGLSYTEELPNLRQFSEKWQSYTYGDVTVSGIEMSGNNASSLYSSYLPGSTRFNVVMLHGNLADTVGTDMIDRRKLAGRGIDYVALGHYHFFRSERIDSTCNAVYSGCLEGRGYDEPGDHGFVLIDTDDGSLSYEFISNAQRRIVLCETDITGAADDYEVLQRIRDNCEARKCDLLRVVLTGGTRLDTKALARELEVHLSADFWDVCVRDRSSKILELGDYESDFSIRGEFIRTVMADSSLTDEERQFILESGLDALSGKEGGK